MTLNPNFPHNMQHSLALRSVPVTLTASYLVPMLLLHSTTHAHPEQAGSQHILQLGGRRALLGRVYLVNSGLHVRPSCFRWGAAVPLLFFCFCVPELALCPCRPSSALCGPALLDGFGFAAP